MHTTTIAACIVAVAALAGCATKTTIVENPEPFYDGPAVRLRHAPGPSNTILVGQATALDYVNARREEVGLPLIALDDGLAAAAAVRRRIASARRDAFRLIVR